MTTHLKTYHRGDLRWQKQREIDFLKRLEGLPHFPQLIGVDEAGVYLSDCGRQIPQSDIRDREILLGDIKGQVEVILYHLEEAGIKHRDITYNNVLWKESERTLYLIDFGWSIWSTETDTPEPVPEVMRSWMCDKTDREQAQVLIEKLESWL